LLHYFVLIIPLARVPCENAYHVQMLLQLRLLLPDSWRVESEVDAESKRFVLFFLFLFPLLIGSNSCDLVVSPLNTVGEPQRVAIELVAHEREGTEANPLRRGSIKEHYHRAATKCTTIEGVKEVWVVTFDTNDTCPWPSQQGILLSLYTPFVIF
jgi:hypothetical protein